MKVLLVEDDRKAARLTSKGLLEAGFLVEVAHSAEDADGMVDGTDYEAIILDLWLPGVDGITFCRNLRARGMNAPILMLTARSALEDLVIGLQAGADDYLTKPFAFEELMARLQALGRRARGHGSGDSHDGRHLAQSGHAPGQAGRRAAQPHPDRICDARDPHAACR